MKIRVYYEDTDIGGVVYHANYLKFCERARSEVFFDAKLSPILKNGHFVATDLKASYKKSAKLGDMLEIESKLIEIKKVSFVLYQEVRLDGVLLFKMSITLAYLNFNNKLQRLTPKEIKIINLFKDEKN